MMHVLFGGMLAAGLLFGLVTREGEQVFSAVLQGAQQAVETALGMAGAFMLFGGLMEILTASSAMDKISRGLKRPLSFLMGDLSGDGLSYVSLNLAANMLGLGNAATPLGVEAARRLAKGPRATNGLCMFLVINASSVQLIPSTVVGLRQALGAQQPGAVILPGLLATALSTAVGIVSCKLMERRP